MLGKKKTIATLFAFKDAAKRTLLAVALLAAGALAVAQSTLSAQNEALFAAAKVGTATDVRAAIKKGANVNARDSDGWTALMRAAYNTNPDVVKALLTAGADVNAIGGIYGGFTALMNAASSNTNPDVVKALIDAGANVNAKDNDGKRAIDYLDDRHKSTFYGTDAYWKMRDLLY